MVCVLDRAISELILHCEQRCRLHETISTLKNPVLSGIFFTMHMSTETGQRTNDGNLLK